MARKAQRPYTQVSSLVGRIGFSVSGNAWTDKNGVKHEAIPKTDGFIVDITYESESDKMYHALCNSAVAVQQTIKKYYWAHGRFPAQPGKVFKAQGDGGMDLPNTVIVDRAVANVATMDIADKIRLATAMGLEVPAEWLATQQTGPVNADNGTDVPDQGTEDAEDAEDIYKYPAGTLDKVAIGKLRVLAQNEELEGYDELTANELREELYAIEK